MGQLRDQLPDMRNSVTREANAPVRGSSFRNRTRRNGATFFNGQSDSTESEFTIDSDSSAHAPTSSFLDRRAPPRRPDQKKCRRGSRDRGPAATQRDGRLINISQLGF